MSVSSAGAPHPILACAEAIRGELTGVAAVQPTFMTVAEKKAVVTEIEAARAALAELEMRVLATAGDVADEHGARDVGSWLRHHTRSDGGPARATTRLATSLDVRWPGVRTAMAQGQVSLEQARVLVEALEALPARVGTDVLARAETELVRLAGEFRPSQLRRLGRHILDVVAPEIAEGEEAEKLSKEEQSAARETSLRIRPLGDGTSRLSGILPEAAAARLGTYLDAYTSPRHHNPHAPEGAPEGGYDLPGELDSIPMHRRRGHALIALLEHLDPQKLPEHGGDATTVIVTLSLDQLRTQLATAGLIDADLSAGPNLTAEQARRLACTARIIPAVLGGPGEILDLGRSRRLFSPAQRKAMRLRDQRCRAEGCTVPGTWTEAHHWHPWSEGGKTDIEDGVCLCSWHHHRVHDPTMVAERLPNGDVRIYRRRSEPAGSRAASG